MRKITDFGWRDAYYEDDYGACGDSYLAARIQWRDTQVERGRPADPYAHSPRGRGLYEALSKKLGVLGWIVSIVVSVAGGFVGAAVGSAVLGRSSRPCNQKGRCGHATPPARATPRSPAR